MGKDFGASSGEFDSIPDFPSQVSITEGKRGKGNGNNKAKSGGGFQTMGLNPKILKGIAHKGYKIPTPVQRKTIPVAIEGRDLVAMARTGSGKTAAFLLPVFQRLLFEGPKEIRAIVLTPTRELALQTLKFIKEIGKYTELKPCLLVGGDNMEDQFALLHAAPDIVVATPGRFLHLLIEMNLRLSGVEIVVYDEADRLFEMGFQQQIHDICQRLPARKQTLLFSATMPKILAEFTKAGLNDPVLIRLDVDTKLSENLHLSHLSVRNDEKPALLMHLLAHKVSLDKPTVVFVATKHHVEHLKELLIRAKFNCAYIYGALDQTERKIQIGKFREGKSNVLLVTDVAARGLDLPLLDCVIHYHFPATPKLFIHRSGRVARAGRSGSAYTFVTADEFPLLLDLHLFLGRAIKISKKRSAGGNDQRMESDEEGALGYVPESLLEPYRESIDEISKYEEVQSIAKVCVNAMKMYIKSRPKPSNESVKRSKILHETVGPHPEFAVKDEEERMDLLESMKNYRPGQTIFEIKKMKNTKTDAFDIMKIKRKVHDDSIKQYQKTKNETLHNVLDKEAYLGSEAKRRKTDDDDDDDDYNDNEKGCKNRSDPIDWPIAPFKRSARDSDEVEIISTEEDNVKDIRGQKSSFYIPHRPSNFYQERGLGIADSFTSSLQSEVLDLTTDDSEMQKQQNKNQKKWDRKKKKFVVVEEDARNKRVKNEAGVWIKASYNTKKYKEWKEKHHVGQSGESIPVPSNGRGRGRGNYGATPIAKGAKAKSELKSKDEIVKERRKKERQKEHLQKAKQKKHAAKKRKGGR